MSNIAPPSDCVMPPDVYASNAAPYQFYQPTPYIPPQPQHSNPAPAPRPQPQFYQQPYVTYAPYPAYVVVVNSYQPRQDDCGCCEILCCCCSICTLLHCCFH